MAKPPKVFKTPGKPTISHLLRILIRLEFLGSTDNETEPPQEAAGKVTSTALQGMAPKSNGGARKMPGKHIISFEMFSIVFINNKM